MSEIILPIGSAALVILVIIVLPFFLYPFVLRYWIDANETQLPQASLTNGGNGNNGNQGKNSRMPAHGAPGPAGANSSPGNPGVDGQQGGQGLKGIGGNDGTVGITGADGSKGVPGFNVIPVKEHLFDTNYERVYYVNGVPITSHINNLTEKATAFFNKEKARIGARLESSFKLESNRTYFRQVLESLVEFPTTTPLPLPDMKLDTIEKWDYFLDQMLSTYTTQRATLKSVKDTELVNISTANNILNTLRSERTIDKAKLDLESYRVSLRTELINEIQVPTVPVPPSMTIPPPLPMTGRYYMNLELLKTPPLPTFDSVIRSLNNELATQTLIYSTTTNTPEVRNAASAEINQLNIEINGINLLKTQVKQHIDTKLHEICEKSRIGGQPTAEHTQTFYDYTPGTESQKTAITTSHAIITAQEVACQAALDAISSPYKTANPI